MIQAQLTSLTTASLQGMVLLVDDERAVCDLTGTMLEMQGFRVMRTNSGDEAVRIFEAGPERVGILVADIVMPVMSGPTLAQRLRSFYPDLPVLFLSGLVSEPNFDGVMGGWFLLKPYTPRLLARKIYEVIASYYGHSTPAR